MIKTSTLLTSPPEIRTAIYKHLFDSAYPIHLRTPSHRRLKCSRIDKEDPRGILSVCHQLRREALPIFFSLNILYFRNSLDALEFFQDQKIHQSIREVISRIVVDDGDTSFQFTHLWEAQSWILSALPTLPNLETMEFRVYARHDNTELMKGFKDIRCCWNEFSKQAKVKDAEKRSFFSSVPYELYSDVFDAVTQSGLVVDCIYSRAKYDIGDKTASVFLNCNNLVVGRPGMTKTLLGGADQAATQRCTRVGTLALRDENTLRFTDD